jgi:hypothetical protein
MSVADALVEHVVETHTTTAETNKKLKELTIRMGMFFASGTAHRLRQTDPAIWGSYVTPDNKPVDNVRIATIDLDSITGGGSVVFLKQSAIDPRHNDGGGTNKSFSASPPVTKFNPAIVTSLVDYLRQLLGTELKDIVEVTKAAAASGNKRRSVISLDYYSNRSTVTSNLHKDTMGITLFVALHYLNPTQMLGPEFIYDKWPLKVLQGEGKYNFSPFQQPDTDKYDGRFQAPWKKIREHYFWPRQLLKDLEEARAQLPDDRTLHHVNLGANGLITFVDELIYHATPLNRSRTAQDLDERFKSVKFGGFDFHVVPDKLKRSVSFSLQRGEQLPSITGGAATRCFVRLWISVCDRDWYEPIVGM